MYNMVTMVDKYTIIHLKFAASSIVCSHHTHTQWQLCEAMGMLVSLMVAIISQCVPNIKLPYCTT